MDSSSISYVREDELSISVLQSSKPKHSNIILYLTNMYMLTCDFC
jgi:hypothetical protein